MQATPFERIEITGARGQRAPKDRRAYEVAELNRLYASKLYVEGYLRGPSYDRLLSVLLPGMAAAPAKPGGKRHLDTVPSDGDPQAAMRAGVRTRQRARFLDRAPRSKGTWRGNLDTRPGDTLLKGRDLEAWKKAKPESAKLWFGDESEGGGSPEGTVERD